MTRIVIVKSLVIAFVAALAAWLPMAAVLTWDAEEYIIVSFGAGLLPIAFLGSYLVGLPIALLSFFLAGDALKRSPGPVFLAANLAGTVLVLLTFLLGDLFGAIFLGIPSLISANVFALLGWLWILKPQKEPDHA